MTKASVDIRSLARAHTAKAIRVLVGIMNETKSPAAARVAAANALMDRGWGKPTQPLSGEDGQPIQIIQRIERIIVDPTMATDDPAEAAD